MASGKTTVQKQHREWENCVMKVPKFFGPVVLVMVLLIPLSGLMGALGVPWYGAVIPAVPFGLYLVLWTIELFFRAIAVPFVDWMCGGRI
jgi:hypothetical protein